MTSVTYRVASIAAGRRLLRGLAEVFPSRAAEPLKRCSTLLDTFDWRVGRDGGTLTVESGEPNRLVWSSADGSLRHRAPVAAIPAFVDDLPDSPLRRALEGVVEMRRLLPVATLEHTTRGVDVIDDRDKAVCRIALESGTAAPPGAERGKRLGPVLRVTAVRGYRRAFEDIVRRLDAKLGDARADGSELQRIAAAIGRNPGDVPRKQTYDIRAGTRADVAMKSIHRALLATFRRNEAGMREDLDSEFLHDARVAVRRTRSALTQVPGVFPTDDVRRFKRELRWLGGVTGPTRDLDVYLLKMPAYRAALDASHRADLAPLIALLHERQQAAHKRLVVDLDSPRLKELMRDWETFLAAAVPATCGLPHAMRPVEELASERIRRAWRRVLKRGRRIGPDSPAERLHELRIDCKKLRYLLEFFASLHDKKRVKGLVGSLKGLQTNLGDLNDLAVQTEALRGFEAELEARGRAPATVVAIEKLVAQLERERIVERGRFEASFAAFDAKPVATAFRQLLGPESTP